MNSNNSRRLKFILVSVILLIAVLSGALIGATAWILRGTPDISDYGHLQPTGNTKIYSADGEVLSRLYQQNRVYASIDEIPNSLQQAIISTEDIRFYEHYGIDLRAIGRALWVDIIERRIAQGGSTITQQLARNAMLTLDQTFYRKIQEAYLAIQFERKYTKNEILEFYLNEIYLGHDVYGVRTAARYYFDKDIEDLSLAESALLAGLPRAPNYYSPYNNPEAAKRRRNIVLSQMENYGFISADEAEAAKEAPVETERGVEEIEEVAPYFVRHVRDQLISKFGAQAVYNEGLQVYTTLDYEMQQQAEKIVNEALESYIPSEDRSEGMGDIQPQIAVTTIEAQSGHIKTMIGGRGEDQYNRVTQAHRQPGSAFKPFVYATAINQGYSPGSIIDDTPKTYTVDNNERTWTPRNYNDEYLGPTTLRVGLARSVNVMAVKLLDEVGIDNTFQTARSMGIESLVREGDRNDRNLALSLGGITRGTTPLSMASAYGVLANQGIRTEPIAITKVEDSNGNVLVENKTKQEIIFEEETSYMVTDMLRSAISRGADLDRGPDMWGTGWRANFGRPAAGKTGTSSNNADAWFVGYTPDLVTSLWIGEDSPRKMEYKLKDSDGEVLKDDDGNPRTEVISSSHASRLWGEYMEKITSDRSVEEFSRPDNIITKQICNKSGKLPGDYCPEHTIEEEVFIEGTEPTEECTLHQPTIEVEVNTESGLLATEHCPEDEVEVYTYQEETGIRVDRDGVPIRKVDPETKVPLEDEEGNYIYEKKPEEICTKHMPEDELQKQLESRTDRIRDRFWDFFNPN
ncbi:transglycosylase domain-containing protein [Fuchsiella alkaliacetigena]|uniref:transglycosylase domain-containing protein n=1 Tax=Fuchsiella alkaliacetigena TaxID=957042 RepID=UPI00200A0DB6|nr:PBP1A family penicillin-binding protein [Fuchsiella alkaliacetigena]MCK8825080.1 PBP1A family penicillin-binding protein [Fuchsiella alkaliacetigena]